MTTHLSISDEVLDFLLSKPSPEAVIALRPSAAAQARLELLLDRSRDALLTDAERLELENYLRVEHFVRQLKIRAQERLSEAV
jgi:uncharacterized protein YciW